MKLLSVTALALLSVSTSSAQALAAAKMLQPPTDAWPTYNGDYSGRRFSTLTKINDKNINSLSLAWVYRVTASPAAGFWGGAIKATPLVVDGVMYFSLPDRVWAIDARSGRQLWEYTWPSKGGIHIGSRGVGIYHNWLYVETPDCNLVALNLKDGKERWHKSVCDLDQLYFGSVAPVVINNHVIVGVSGDDLDTPGYLEARDPETGELQWHWSVVPKPGEPGSESWPSADAMMHGGGMTWVPSTYDPDLNLLYLGTGNPQPVIAGKSRPGDNLFTESIVALDLDSGKMKWYFQSSPHDTHDWDAVQTPVLIDAEINGQQRKLVAQASRNGYFFVLDRATGKNVVTKPFVKLNWSKGIAANGQPIPNPQKEPQIDGALVTPNQGGAANWFPPSYSPQAGLFYINATRGFSVYYIFDDEKKPEGWGGNDKGGYAESMLEAIDPKTGNIRWNHKWEGSGIRSGVLSTAGNLVFAGDPANNLVALNATTGDPLWHVNLGSAMTNGPVTYELDGTQYLVVGAGDTMYAFAMRAK
jgi:alcohol dehydrogenase (cytochrome c)